MKHLLISVAIAASLATSAVASSLSDTYSSFVIFGDSLSDNGNLFGTSGLPPAPYFDGRFSNGPVWNEAIADEFPNGDQPGPALGGTGGNLAFGGARADNDLNTNDPSIPSVQTQIGIYLGTGGTFTPGTLVSHWAGANDIFQDLSFGTGEAVGADAAFAASENLSLLIGLGAQNILSFNLPDIGKSPAYLGTLLADDATDATKKYNDDLAEQIALYRLLSPQTNIIEIDVFSIFDDILDSPSDFGLSNVTDQCLTTLTCVLGDADAQDAFLFWDEVHPTRAGHRLIEAAVRDALAPVPLPAGAPLYLIGMIGFGLVARRR